MFSYILIWLDFWVKWSFAFKLWICEKTERFQRLEILMVLLHEINVMEIVK